MRNITFSAEDQLIERARLRAAKEKTTLNLAFREWLSRYAQAETGQNEYQDLMNRLSAVQAGAHFTRDEMNQR